MVAEFVAGAATTTIVAETGYLTDWFRLGKKRRARRRAKRELLEGIDATRETLRTLARRPEKPPKDYDGFLWRLYGIRVAGIYDQKYRGSEDQREDYKRMYEQMVSSVKSRKLSPENTRSLLNLMEEYVKKDF